jgi:hypothetical protein
MSSNRTTSKSNNVNSTKKIVNKTKSKNSTKKTVSTRNNVNSSKVVLPLSRSQKLSSLSPSQKGTSPSIEVDDEPLLLTEEETSKLYPERISVNITDPKKSNKKSSLSSRSSQSSQEVSLTNTIFKIFNGENEQNYGENINIENVFEILLLSKNVYYKPTETGYLRDILKSFGLQVIRFINCEKVSSITSYQILHDGLKELFLKTYKEQSNFLIDKNVKRTSLTIGSIEYSSSKLIDKKEENEELTNLINDNLLYQTLKKNTKEALEINITFFKEAHFPELFLNVKCNFSNEAKIALLGILDSLAFYIMNAAVELIKKSGFNITILTNLNYLQALNTDSYLSLFFEVK